MLIQHSVYSDSEVQIWGMNKEKRFAVLIAVCKPERALQERILIIL